MKPTFYLLLAGGLLSGSEARAAVSSFHSRSWGELSALSALAELRLHGAELFFCACAFLLAGVAVTLHKLRIRNSGQLNFAFRI